MATILIVDDSPVNRRFLVTLLGHHGHRLLQAGDGAEVLAMVRVDRPDLIITDVMMPVMDGYELLRQIRLDPQARRIPVVFYTAHYGARALALECGAAWFLSNADSAEVLSVVGRVLAGETEGRERPGRSPAMSQQEARAESGS